MVSDPEAKNHCHHHYLVPLNTVEWALRYVPSHLNNGEMLIGTDFGNRRIRLNAVLQP